MKKLDETLEALHPLEAKLLLGFGTVDKLSGDKLTANSGISESDFRRAAGWLKTKEFIYMIPEKTETSVSLTELGRKYLKNGVPEKQIVDFINAQYLKDKVPTMKSMDFLERLEISEAVGFLKQKSIMDILQGGVLAFKDSKYEKNKTYPEVEFLQDLVHKVNQGALMESLVEEDRRAIEERHRKRGKGRGIFEIREKTTFTFELTALGKEIIAGLATRKPAPEKISQLTPELLKDGEWRTKEFREYNIDLRPPRAVIGRFHPYQQFLSDVRKKLISMGFCEVTGELVESEFWDTDALFMPQFHPAREIHGLYFVKSPKYAKEIDPQLLDNVSKTHENGWRTGSSGWQYKFDKERARRLILRSQGTVLSARTLALHPEPPGKYFTIARCFRPDAVDSTHAPDFFQMDGIVVSEHANFRLLLGLLKMFAKEIAQASEVKFIPAYFPFTEPSVELHAKHPKLGWIELGGAGIFRPEVTIPLGVKTPVIAWGLGLDRMAMLALGIHDIRDFFSRDLELLRQIKS
jgi:phenylalanyl-tRNA synthetase alpha chain